MSKVSFKEFIKLLYVEKNLIYFRDVLQSPFPKNVQTWKMNELTIAFDLLNISKLTEDGKQMTVPMMKSKLLTNLNINQDNKEKLNDYLSQGKKTSELDYPFVQKTIWLNKNPKDW